VARLERLRVPRRTIEAARALIERHMDWPALPKMRAAKQRRFLLREDFAGHLELHRLDCEACHRDLSIHAYATRERARLDAEPPPVRPLLDGNDLKAMGFRPGPGMGRILEALVDAQLEGSVEDPAQARTFVAGRFAPPDGRELAEEGRS